MRLIGGADGCKGGWFLVTKDLKSGCISYKPCRSTHDLFFNASSLDVLALDIPIGLKDKGSLALSDHAAVVVDIRQGKSKLDHKLES